MENKLTHLLRATKDSKNSPNTLTRESKHLYRQDWEQRAPLKKQEPNDLLISRFEVKCLSPCDITPPTQADGEVMTSLISKISQGNHSLNRALLALVDSYSLMQIPPKSKREQLRGLQVRMI